MQSTLRYFLILSFLLAGVGAVAAGCGGAAECNGDSCNCPQGQTCDFGSHAGSARFTCETNSTCSGSGGQSSDVTCAGALCTVSVGASSNVTCSSGTCNVTCNGPCSVASTANLNLTCSGGTPAASGCE